ncbi:MAG TPA: S8 family serine peptidase, partial [Actinomycetota bacterium]|nr:S8 family serine peptidase [Actinomycetota bacterium]
MARTLCPHLRGVLVAALAAALAVPGTSIAQASGPGSGETASFSSGRPGPDLFSEKYVQDAVRRCRGMDLLLRDTVSGHGLSIGPADGPGRLVPLPSNEPGRYALECSDGYLVELEGSAPTEPTASITSIVPGAELVQQFDTLFDGIHVRLSPGEAEELRARGFTVWENAEVRATVRESVPLINADAVWSRGSPVQGAPWVTGQTGRGSTIAIVDTGIDYRHPDLGNGCFELPPRVLKESPCKVVGGYDVVNGDPDPVDDHGHGTHVAAIAAGNGVLKGVAPDAKLYAFKVLNAGGWGTFDQVIEGLERAVDPNGDGRLSDAADVINLSLGGYGNPDDPLSRAVDNAVGAGSVVAVAAGNGSYGVSDEEKISSPGTSLTAITVGATTKADEMTSFSSRGPV